MRKFLIWFSILLFGADCYAQKYRVEALTVADGLSQGFVIDLFQDSRGFVWISTSNGLNRYDGYQIKRFTPDKTVPWSLEASVIYCVAEDSHGLLWMGTDRGLVVMDPYTERFVLLPDINPAFIGQDVVKIHLDDHDRVWFCYRKPAENMLGVARPPADLIGRIRQNQLQSIDFQVQPVRLAAGLVGPLGWMITGSDSIINAIDNRGQFCRINPLTLQVQKADPRSLSYQRWGNYGLVYARQKTFGFTFPVYPDDSQNNVPQAIAFLQLPGEKPLLYLNGESTLYQMDTNSVQWTPPAFRSMNFYDQLTPFIELDKAVSYLGIVDRLGNLWMGTTGYGVRKISPRQLDFRQYLPRQSFYNFTLLPDGRIWPGHYQPYAVLNLHSNQLEPAPWVGLLPVGTKPHSLLVARSGEWWMAAVRNSQLLLLTGNHPGQPWKELPATLKFSEDFPVSLLEDHRGNIWVAGVQGEIIRIRPDDRHIDRWQIEHLFPAVLINNLHSTCLVEGAPGTIWIGQSGGLVRVQNTDGEPVFRAWHNYTDQGLLFSNDYFLSLYPDPGDPRLLWAGTRGGGLIGFDQQLGTCQTFTEKDGLANNVVYGIQPDASDHLWLSTNQGLSSFNPHNHTFRNFQNTETALNVEFNTGAHGRMPSGELAFGSVEGLFLLHPLAESQPAPYGIVEVTQLKINGLIIDPAATRDRLCFNDRNEVSLHLPFDQNNLILEFAALQTLDPVSAQYRYRVLGLAEQWILTGHERTANLVALPPGKYTIELQSIGTDGRWTEAPVTRVLVTIRPPWYLAWPAWLLYGGVVFLLLYAYVYYERLRLQLKHTGEIDRKEMERLKSLDDFKNRFFGYISHEFKTPLTIIMGQAKRLPGQHNQQELIKNAAAIFQQGQSMLEMVNQMVDVSRLDDQALRLNWRNGNFSDYVRYLVESLRALTDFKNIRLDFQTAVPELRMDFDPLRLKYIVNNLLSNAIRHTSPGGSISISIQPQGQDQILLRVLDTGEGISTEDLPNIFDRHYQGASNNPQPHHFGLGLAFVKDLLQFLAGKIEVSSQLGQGSVFTVYLPVTQQAPPLETPFPAIDRPEDNFIQKQPAGKLPKNALPLLLIVEDNPFISNFMQATLAPYFTLEFALDGSRGYEKAVEIIPDLILTDVVMPGINGFELAHKLKSHELTGHIPIVVLSARSDLSDRLTGRQSGADVYIAKPFDEQELIMTLQNLHRLQRRWRERYAGITTQVDLVDNLPADTPEQREDIIRQTDAFMLKIYASFEKNYPREGYDLLQLCRDIEMSKSQLQRKLAALSDQSAMQLLRRYRLQKAYDILLENPNHTVKEICFQVGFKDPSHFSRLFSKTFRVAPSDMKNNQIEKPVKKENPAA